MNINKYFKVNFDPLNKGKDFFTPDSDYYQLNDSWLPLVTGSSQANQPCLDTSSCYSNLKCFRSPDTNENACFANSTVASKAGFSESVPDNPSLFNYGTDTLYTAICSQKLMDGSQSFISYYPDYKSQTLLKENNKYFSKNCQNYTFQQTTNTDISCYDADQLSGTKIVELCQAKEVDNNICIDTNGNKVYYPTINPLYIRPSSNLCEDNTSINYISFNFNNVPQNVRSLYSGQGAGLSNNQIYCLSLDFITYYTNFNINIYGKNNYYVTFSGTWGYMYSYILSSTDVEEQTIKEDTINNITWFDTDADKPLKLPDDSSKIENIVNRLQIDFSYGITYVIPAFKITSQGVVIGDNILSMGNIIDTISLDPKYKIVSTITLKPCSMFDTSYGQNKNSNTYLLDNSIDKQKFKVERFGINTDTTDPLYGSYTQDSKGMISSIVYRNLNYENGGLYLDYYVPPDDIPESDINKKCPTYLETQQEGLVFRKKYDDDDDTMKKWILMPPLDLSPYTTPSGGNMWCNFAYDFSSDGGHTFNKSNGPVAPMETIPILEGQEIIDPVYKSLTVQPDNNLFNAIGDIVYAGGAFAALVIAGNIPSDSDTTISKPIAEAEGAINTGIKLWDLTTKKNNFHLQNVDAAFGRCSQFCSNSVTVQSFPPHGVPNVKAVALNSGTLGSAPPGHDRGVTQEFSVGDVVFGMKFGHVPTCAYFYQYHPTSSSWTELNPETRSISSHSPGDLYRDGNVEFIIEDVFKDTYLFDKSYFNDSSVLIIDSIVRGGKGYGQTAPPQNCIVAFNNNGQVFKQSFTSRIYDPNVTSCTRENISKCNLDGSVNYNVACGDYSILVELMDKLDNYDWWIEVDENELKMKAGFSNQYCGNPTSGMEIFYYLSIILPYFEFYEVKRGSFDKMVVITDIDKYFPSLSDPTKIDFDLFILNDDGHKEYLFDEDGNKLTIQGILGGFEVQQRLYYKTTFVAVVNFLVEPGSGGVITNIDELEITMVIDQTFLNENMDKDLEYELQEWWILSTNFMNQPQLIEYRNLNATGCVIKLGESDKVWNILERAPRNIIREGKSPLIFPQGDPMSLSNNSTLKHGPSPQQMIYAGSFESANQECFKLKKDDCTKSELCSWNDTNQYCLGTNLLDLLSESYGYIFTNTSEFDPTIFNTKSNQSHFTDITFFKSLQISELNYSEYIPLDNQKVTGSAYQKPEFVDYKQQKIENFGNINIDPNNPGEIGSGPDIKLGRFIPYEYFYPTFIEDSQVEDDPGSSTKHTVGIETSAIGIQALTRVNNFYYNPNAAQFIPYGKKSLYENGFTSKDTVPTF